MQPSVTPDNALRVVAGAWLRSDGALLAALRPAHKSLGGHWELPGGKVEAFESDAAALARELYEELGVQVTVREFFGEAQHEASGTRIHLLAYIVSCAEAPRALEHEALRWVAPADWSSVGWAPADQALIATLIRHLVHTTEPS